MANMLEPELKTFEAHKSELIGSSKGKYALVKEDRIVNVFDAKMDAIRQGYERFGTKPFLVKQIVEVEVPQSFTSNVLAI
ncbi:hypothetical protein FJY63_15095 [Candidatus Sumerlaeota bacterium]|nr:hypothetical protein [Candidatus Sumerlaeota bacterium]